ncbi:hypothetical protein EHQ67_13220 [Leptospira kmetyi]|nr:hypothetical protein EHQ67_13220 [Leptospira kmetyi]
MKVRNGLQTQRSELRPWSDRILPRFSSSKKRKLSLFSFSGLIPIQIAWNPKTSNQPGICKTGR